MVALTAGALGVGGPARPIRRAQRAEGPWPHGVGQVAIADRAVGEGGLAFARAAGDRRLVGVGLSRVRRRERLEAVIDPGNPLPRHLGSASPLPSTPRGAEREPSDVVGRGPGRDGTGQEPDLGRLLVGRPGVDDEADLGRVRFPPGGVGDGLNHRLGMALAPGHVSHRLAGGVQGDRVEALRPVDPESAPRDHLDDVAMAIGTLGRADGPVLAAPRWAVGPQGPAPGRPSPPGPGRGARERLPGSHPDQGGEGYRHRER